MKDLLQRAKEEITQLRRSNEVLSAKVEVVNIFAAALGLRKIEGGYGPDVAWELQKEIDLLSQTQPSITNDVGADPYGNRDFD